MAKKQENHQLEALLPLPPVTFQILLALADEDRHGYAILKEIEDRTGGEVRIGAGTLYRSVHRMLEQGLVAELRDRPRPAGDDERRRYYRLTSEGRAVAEAEARRLERMVDHARALGFVPGGAT